MRSHLARLLMTLLVGCLLTSAAAAAEPPLTGPETEKRFPPLVVPAGFKATLFACDPLIEYPSVIAAGPRPGAAFVAIDYMTGLGTEIVKRSEIRLVQDTDGDGYADAAPVFADGFNSIMGVAWQRAAGGGGTLFVMHAPLLTAIRDADGDGKADERKDLLTGLGLTPEENPVRLHCANGVTIGHDGWLYLALGDHGANVPRPEGDKLVFNGGGILRCRPDGRDLHVFASGLRNIYDVALDAELNVFVRDNENDGGDYKIRVCHSFVGADHGYPYNYYERPEESLPPLADLGLGSSAGGACYLETQFPAEYRGNLFFCEWGKSLVRYQPARDGSSSFAPLKEIEFATSPANDPYGFKPTDVVVQQDGSLLVSDWCDGQRPKRGRGRIYCIQASGGDRQASGGDRQASGGRQPPEATDVEGHSPADLLTRLNSKSYATRCDAQAALERLREPAIAALIRALQASKPENAAGRMHAVWALARLQPGSPQLLEVVKRDPDPGVRVQAIRAIADAADPVLLHDRLDAGRGEPEIAASLANAAKGQEPRVVLEIVVALGRLKWSESTDWLTDHVKQPDAAVAHAAQQVLRRVASSQDLLRLIDRPGNDPLRAIAVRAASERFDSALVAGLIERLRADPDAQHRQQLADLLARLHRRPGPWVYWNYRPAPRSANTQDWEQSEAIAAALAAVLADPDRALRLAALKRMQREKISFRATAVVPWLEEERDESAVAAILVSLADQPAAETRPLFVGVVRERRHSLSNRQAALATLGQGLAADSAGALLPLLESIEEGPLLAGAIRLAGQHPQPILLTAVAGKLSSRDGEVRAAAIEVLGAARSDLARQPLAGLLDDPDARVRRAAARAAGQLAEAGAAPLLLKLAAHPDPGVRSASLEALRTLKEPRAVPLAAAALADRQTEAAALQVLAELGGPEQAGAVADLAKRSPSADTLTAAVRVLTDWGQRKDTSAERQAELDRLVSEIHGTSGSVVRWRVSEPLAPSAAALLIEKRTPAEEAGESFGGQTRYAAGTEARVALPAAESTNDSHWLALAEIAVAEPAEIELLASSSGRLRLWLNDKQIISRDALPGGFRLDSDRARVVLEKGPNRVLLEVASSASPAEFHLRFRRKNAVAEHERLAAAALSRAGNIERGRQHFLNAEKSLCLKCHRYGDQGERTGPELTGIGSRFSRIHIVESILEPSRTIAPSYGTLAVLLADGTTVTGVKVAETETTLTLVDREAVKRELAKSNIDQQRASPLSTMPDGLEKRFSEDEFVDLAAFLASLKEMPRAP